MRFAVLHHLESGPDAAASAVYDEVAEQVRLADELGFETAWVAEHHFAATKGRAPFPLLLLTHLAGRTRKIRLGTAVLPAPFYQPIRLAESIAMADVLMGGRLDCGISSSGVPDEMRIFNVPQDGKHDQLRDILLWLRRAWSGEAVQVPNATASDAPTVTIVPLPLQRVEDMVWVAASTPGAAEVAGALGHHLLLPSLRPPSVSAANLAIYRNALAAAGVSLSSRHIQCTLHLILNEDHTAAMQMAAPVARFYYERYVANGSVQRLEDESLGAIMARINFVAGGPEAVAEQITAIAEALSLTHVALQARLIGLPHIDTMRALELAMTRVAPLLRTEP
ncbi:MAG TPA: LLM class flavin-dependent oxidoreductase [Dehalococcoidia bacterium]|nr:LLM class flavin-dependent oxidoreductase [Dehalococcoidia bacterium]